jgi:hypothetical protein
VRATLLMLLATLSVSSFAAEPTSEQMLDLIRAQQAQIEQLQLQLDATRESLQALSRQVTQNAQSSEAANQKAEILADSLDGQPASAQPATTIGGYGELHINRLEDQHSDAENNMLDFHRFVLFFGHDFNDRLRFNSELEIEHAVSGGDEPGEVELEQAYIEYDYAAGHSFRAGLFLLPVGILNETHEPPTFYGVERNPVENYIIPTTWWEGGLASTGQIVDGLRYDLTVTSGLFTSLEDNYAVRDGRQKAAKARFDSPAYTGRLRWLGLPGLELSASLQYQDDITQDADPLAGSALLFSGHLAWQHQGFGLRALYARWTLDGVGPEAVGADRQEGWYIEPSWRANEQWGLFARYNEWDNQAGNAADTGFSQWDIGVNYWLHPNVVFKLDYQDQEAPAGMREWDGWNLGVGYQF